MAAVAALMATSVRHIQRLVSERRIPYLKVGHFVRFDQAEIVSWLDERRVGVYTPPHQRRSGRR
jgi:excisionase family DNA binding protein